MDYARTFMMEKKVSLKYWREVVSTVVYTFTSKFSPKFWREKVKTSTVVGRIDN